MAKFSTTEALKHLGGSAAQIDRELRRFGEAAKRLSSNHPRMIDEHPRQWIGVYDGRVAAAGTSLRSLLAKLREDSIPAGKTVIRFIDNEQRTLIL